MNINFGSITPEVYRNSLKAEAILTNDNNYIDVENNSQTVPKGTEHNFSNGFIPIERFIQSLKYKLKNDTFETSFSNPTIMNGFSVKPTFSLN